MNKIFFCYLLVIGFAIGGILIGSSSEEKISILNVYDNYQVNPNLTTLAVLIQE